MAFQAASLQQQTGAQASDDVSVVQFYAKEASRLMLECLKKGPSAGAVEEPKPHVLETVFDISNGDREFLTEDAATQLLQPLTVPGNSYTSICFSNRSFGEDAAKVAAKVLQALKPQLTEVNLADIVAGRDEQVALSVMSIFSSSLEGCNLKSLNLSDNALGEKGVRAFTALLKSQHALEELYFMNTGISEEAAMAISELIPSAEKLRVLHFHNNMTGDDGAVAISGLVRSAPDLEDFQCSSTRVGTEGGFELSNALLAGCSLRRIDLRDNPFGKEAGIALAKALKQHMGLKEVYLSYLGLEDEGSAAVLEALRGGAPGLQVLDMAGNDMTTRSAKRLADCISSKTHLTKLNLSENELEDKGVVTVCDALHGLEGLIELDLSETDIGRIGACAAAQAVTQKPAFKLLSINGNHISESGVDAVKALLQKGIHGTSVLGSLDDNEEEEKEDEEETGGDAENGDLDDELQTQLSKVRME